MTAAYIQSLGENAVEDEKSVVDRFRGTQTCLAVTKWNVWSRWRPYYGGVSLRAVVELSRYKAMTTMENIRAAIEIPQGGDGIEGGRHCPCLY